MIQRLFTWLLSFFGLRAAPVLVRDHRSCTFCRGPVCLTCRNSIRYEAFEGRFCSVECQKIAPDQRVPEHVVQSFTDGIPERQWGVHARPEPDGPTFGKLDFGDD